MAIVQSFGAAETVTGSCHLLQLQNGINLLIDCGMFQGSVEAHNRKPFGFDPSEIDFLLITHAHLDHIGRIPKLVKEGFSGTIITHNSTMDLAEVVLMDSAKLQEESYKTAYKKAQRIGEEKSVPKPLYEKDDVRLVYQLPVREARYDETLSLGHGISVTFKNAGHILDSAIIRITFEEDGVSKSVVFSGDLGNNNDLVMPSPDILEEADALFIESTYGDRNHKGVEESDEELEAIIKETINNEGNVLIPSFAIERTQEILCLLKQMYDRGDLPVCKIYLDSPMAIRATEIYKAYHEELSECCNAFLERDGTIFGFPYLNYTLHVHESMKINEEESRCIIIAGAGMCNGGRILQHFKHRLWNEKNALVFVGYQVEGTLGRKIVDGERKIRVYNEDIIIKAAVHTINGFSAHADQSDLIEWMQSFKRLGKIFLIHGERDKQEIFQKEIRKQMDKKAHIVKYAETIGV
ncbi:MBL fold metallo-hydrolase RNA specificity domain-containing protein [Sulfurovum mangrovi]|uniref:MBL fold metallo-hydrolase RNA specificity domain-containing protein n=1 Tax=Sulfurovum mangrovi TaxID=2893889 RepID=UPI001E2C9E16|nr:MBL fold metallo-hydrolase [Sulfurovum mangrovi]UFH60392.1 MBL fold metallo-hydrolase [Sulfurovum mangrovi]